MSKPLQLEIPSPCQEQWSTMQPADRGRHCAACQKTVIDFTSMSDPEIIRYLAAAGPKVCGRLAPDQLSRRLIPLAPAQRNGWAGWKWLLAGCLLTFDKPDTRRPAHAVSHQIPVPPQIDSTQIDTSKYTFGMLQLPAPIIDTIIEDGVKGELVVSPPLVEVPRVTVDSLCVPEGPPQDTIMLPKMDSAGKDLAFTGDLKIREVSRNITVDSIKEFITDTLAALHLIPAKELKVYPNPVTRGTYFHISWQAEPGNYQVALYA